MKQQCSLEKNTNLVQKIPKLSFLKYSTNI